MSVLPDESASAALAPLRSGRNRGRYAQAAWLTATLVLAGVIGRAASSWNATDQADLNRGQRLYAGHEPVTARIAGHRSVLPASTTACVHCHEQRARGLETDAAPPLTRQTLVQDIARRGGPRVRYDRSALCETVRTGVDPNFVTLQRAMPRYVVSDAQCKALWDYLSKR